QLAQIKEAFPAQWLAEKHEDTTQLIDKIETICRSESTARNNPDVARGDASVFDVSNAAVSNAVIPTATPSRSANVAPDELTANTAPSVSNSGALDDSALDSSVSHTSDSAVNAHATDDDSHINQPETKNQAMNSVGLYQASTDRVVRVNADNLKQLMSLAGESLVEVNWLQPFADTMQHLKKRQQSLALLLDQLQREVTLPPSSQKKLNAAKKAATDCHVLLNERIGDLDQFSRRFSQLSDNLYREVIASHMHPFSGGIQGFGRMVRELAKAEGKKVRLEIIGQNTQIDRDILERLEAPLTHMLRNSIAHGIESPALRQQLNKPEIGTIRIEAAHRAGMLSIVVSDDGKGLDLEELRQVIVEKQLTSPVLAARLTEAELTEFLFLPGFSTTSSVTELSGRGVGLDIAKSMVQEVGGLLRAHTKPGEGTSFHFQLPLTLSVIRVLVVEISGEPYAFGLTRIDQVRLIKPEDIFISENNPYAVVDGENISLIKAQQVLELPESTYAQTSTLPVVIIKDQANSYGLIVDRLLGESDLVVKPLDERFGKVQDVSASALTDDGLPLLIIDVADLVRSIEQLISCGSLNLLNNQAEELSQRRKRILVVDDSLTVREMERQLLENHGYQVDVAVNGMEGWNTVRTGDYDLVVSDIDMPRMNGIELVQHIKFHAKLKQLPVIIVSYKDRQSDKVAGLNAGANYYLTKSSFQDDSLLTAVMDLIG
ncbi:MAG: response regulator, partial [Cyanobacteria bacterium J06632_3]